MKNHSHFLFATLAPAIAWTLVAAPATHAQEAAAQDSAISTTVTPTVETSSTRDVAAAANVATAANVAAAEDIASGEQSESSETSALVDEPIIEPMVEPITEPAASVETQLPINPNAGRLTADNIRYDGAILVASNTSDKPVVFQTPDARIEAKSLRIDTAKRTLQAEGNVYIERQRRITRAPLLASSIDKKAFPGQEETVTETLRGQDFRYDFNTQKGSIDKAKLSLTGFTVSTDELLVNGRVYTAKNVLLRPGGLTEKETELYGTPPFNFRAKTLTVESADSATGATSTPENGANVSNPGEGLAPRARVGITGGALYFKNTKLLPVPSYVFSSLNRGPRDPQTFGLTPRFNFNSVDRVLVTTRLRYPLSKNPNGTALNADVGLSARIGLRGGVALEAPTRFGNFGLGLRKSDIVTTQLTNRIELDRTPELTFESRFLPLLRLPGKRLAGLSFSAGGGRFRERTIGDSNSLVSTDRSQVQLNFTTRGASVAGPYLDIFARVASYGNRAEKYKNSGFEIGYAGKMLPRVNGVLSYRATSLSGDTPFRFDRVEIARELRGTVDIEVTPRYIVPLDLRYDLDKKSFRDRTFGVLRNYKTFAYGVVYQTSRNELRAEIRQGF